MDGEHATSHSPKSDMPWIPVPGSGIRVVISAVGEGVNDVAYLPVFGASGSGFRVPGSWFRDSGLGDRRLVRVWKFERNMP